MAAEGEFPKVDGDILYGSDINSFTRNVTDRTTPFTNAGSWDAGAVPNNLTNFVDGDITSFTGIGSIECTTSRPQVIGGIIIDTGSNVTHSTLSVKYRMTTPIDGPDFTGRVWASPNAVNWNEITDLKKQGTDVTTDEGVVLTASQAKFRYIRVGVVKEASITTGGFVTFQGWEVNAF